MKVNKTKGTKQYEKDSFCGGDRVYKNCLHDRADCAHYCFRFGNGFSENGCVLQLNILDKFIKGINMATKVKGDE